MRNFYIATAFFSLVLSGMVNGNVHGQCANTNSPYLDLTPTGVGNTQTSACTFAGDYNVVAVCSGASYTFSSCSNPGSHDTRITLYEDATGTYIGENDNGCGNRATITWVATFSGVVRVLLDLGDCSHDAVCHQMDVTQNTAGSAPANDDPCNAFELPIGSTCNFSMQSLACATWTFSALSPSCGGFTGGPDVWFYFVAPPSGLVNVDTRAAGITDGAMASYPNVGCASFLIPPTQCQDDNSPTSLLMPFMTFSGLTPGDTIYLRFWSYNHLETGTFEICAVDPAPPGGNPCGAVIPDSCANACYLGTLATPVPCNGSPNEGEGAVSTFNLSNIGATAESPYFYQSGCMPSGDMAAPAADVWYTFVPSGSRLDVTISGNLSDPMLGLWEGTCGNFYGRGCATGSGNSLTATFDLLTPFQTYYLQISGGTLLDQGTFDLTLQSRDDCQECLQQASLVPSPLPINGTYPPATNVTFTLDINYYYRNSDNWLHGVIPTFGPGWDTNSLTVTPSGSCDGFGMWGWYNSVTSALNASTHGPGFFYESSQGHAPAGPPNGNPGDNYGDNCITGSWQFSWQIQTTASGCAGGGDLDISVSTTSDGESGNWSPASCPNDPSLYFTGGVSCALPVDFIYLKGKRETNGNLVQWATSQELITEYFAVERSTDGIFFDEVGRLDGHGNSDQRQEYSFYDDFTSEGITYYRLRVHDFNGNENFSETVTILFETRDIYITELYPNPVVDFLNVDLILPADGSYDFLVLDMMGRVVQSKTEDFEQGMSLVSLNVNDLSHGNYVLHIRNRAKGVATMQKFVK